MNRARLTALLVGIDFYRPSALGYPSYRPLRGCVADVREVHRYLVEERGADAEAITILTASDAGGTVPPDPEDALPTYERLCLHLQRLIERADADGEILFYYSGHGGRCATALPHVKGLGALDECLVPLGVEGPQAHYLRDHELAAFAVAVAARQARLTMVLDCCHSAGMSRAAPEVVGSAKVRSGDGVDRRPPPASDSFLTLPLQAAAWRELSGQRSRALTLASGWLPSLPPGVVLLAACRAWELAHEALIAGRHQGAFSHELRAALGALPTAATYEELHAHLAPRVRARFASQTPVLEGDGRRILFGDEAVRSGRWVVVEEVSPGAVVLAAGAASGVRVGDRFALHPPTGDLGSALAVARIREVHSFRAIGELIEVSGEWALLQPGARAVRSPGERTSPDSEPADDLTAREHRARFLDLLELENRAPGALLGSALGASLASLPADWQPSGPIRDDELTALEDPARVSDGDWLCLTVDNRSPRVDLHVSVLNLGQDWSIQRVVPNSPFASPLHLHRGARRRLPFRARHLGGAPRPIDVLLILATTEPIDCGWLELPPLASPASRTALAPTTEGLAAALAAALSAGRRAVPATAADAGRLWTVQRLAIEVLGR